MPILFKLFNLIILLILTVALVIYGARTGNLNSVINYALQYYLQLNNFNAKISHLTLKNDQVIIDSMLLSKNNIQLKLDNIVATYYFDLDYKKSKFFVNIQVDKITGQTVDNKEIFNAKINCSYNNYVIKRKSQIHFYLEDIFYKDSSSDIENKIDLAEGKSNIDYFSSKKHAKYNINVDFKDITTLNLQSEFDNNIIITGNIKNMPIEIYKPAYYLYPQNNLLVFLNNFIKTGTIESSEFNVNISEQNIKNSNYNIENINGLTKISNLTLMYSNELPPLTNMQLDIFQKGTITEFVINKGNSTDLIIDSGLIYMDWKGAENTTLFITAKAQGPTKALTDFIAINTHETLRQASIDLRKITGKTDVDIKIEIPLNPGSKDVYSINAKMPNTALSIFNDKIILNKADISGKYNGDNLQITGKGKINQFDSEINFVQNLTNQKEFHHKLSIATDLHLKGPKKTPQKIGFMTIVGGNAKLNFEYINSHQEGKITTNSDLEKLDIYFDKLGIHKKKGEKANLALIGILESPTKGNINFNINGVNNLNITGSAKIDNNITKIILDNINHRETKLSSKILINKDLFDIEIKGKSLDLSEADMLSFLEKERNSGSTKIRLRVDEVKLKNYISLNNLELKFACSSIKCYTGYVDAKIGSKKVEMTLNEEEDWEQWLIKSGNAGALLKGIGLYEDMRAGTMLLSLKTSRKKINAGEIIPIVNGTFEFERFVLHDAPSLSKLVSFVSLPGFVNIISGNKDIIFSNMNGKFSFQEGVLNVSHSYAAGPFFGFTMAGNINTLKRTVDLTGQVTPSLYGLNAIIGSVPIIGKVFTGDKTHAGIISAPYKLKDSY